MYLNMPLSIPKKQVSLFFKSAAAISQFKQESAAQDFYIDRDALAMVGFFTDEQLRLAVTKYKVKCITTSQ